jgi:hypothetical protein
VAAILVSGIAAFDFGHLVTSPLIEFVSEGAMLRVEKWQAQMCGPAHDGSPPGRMPGFKASARNCQPLQTRR